MINTIYLNGSMITDIEKSGRINLYHLASGEILLGKKEIKKIEIECYKCKAKRSLSRLNDYNLKNKTLCSKCKSLGTANPFYGKKHKQISKEKISKQNKNRLVGNKNPMFGKSVFEHWNNIYGLDEANKRKKESSIKLSKATSGSSNPMYQKTLTDEQKQKKQESYAIYLKNRSKEQKEKTALVISSAQKKLCQLDPIKYKEQRRKAGKLSHISNGRYKKNKPEIKVSEELNKRGLNNFQYSVILDKYQFDFGCKKQRFLLEVQGDYWHGNPKIYKKLNSIQKHIKQKDKLKAKFAKKHGFRIFYIWETEINNEDFKILDQIKDIINEI